MVMAGITSRYNFMKIEQEVCNTRLEITCPTYLTWPHLNQHMLEISIYLSWDKLKSIYNSVFHKTLYRKQSRF